MRRLLLLLPILTLAAPRPADACSAPQCWPGAFVPGGEAATIPENAPGLFWRPSMTNGQPADPSTVRLVRLGDTTPIPFTPVAEGADWVLVPHVPFVAGTQYVLEETASCNDAPGARSVFTAGPSAPLPATLGTVRSSPHGRFSDIEVATSSGSCSTTVGATVLEIALDHSADAAPWKDLLLYDTLVDGAPWVNQTSINQRTPPGASWRGRGEDLLYRICEPNPDAGFPGLPAGGHQIAFRASLPGTATTFATPDQALEIMCTSRPDDPNDPDDGDGGGCSTSTPASAGFVLLALALLFVRRRDQNR